MTRSLCRQRAPLPARPPHTVFQGGHLLGGLVCAALVLGSSRYVQALSCIGDCNGDGMVTINELIAGVRLAVGTLVGEMCPAFDRNRDGNVGVDELVGGVNAALCGCGRPCPTPLPVRTFTATSPPSETPTPSPSPRVPTATAAPTRTPTRRSGQCVRVKQGLWCLFVGDVLGIEDQLTQSGCTIQFADQSLRGPISGNCWTVDNRQFDVRLTCCFSGGDPAMHCDGSGDVQGRSVNVEGWAGACEDR